jgi:hypothetical protein
MRWTGMGKADPPQPLFLIIVRLSFGNYSR